MKMMSEERFRILINNILRYLTSSVLPCGQTMKTVEVQLPLKGGKFCCSKVNREDRFNKRSTLVYHKAVL
jgi:hypothetical protein